MKAQSLAIAIAVLTFATELSAQSIWGIEFSPDGNYLAAAISNRGNPGTTTIWKTDDWSIHTSYRREVGALDVDFSHDSKQLLIAERNGHVGLIDVESKRFQRSYQITDGGEIMAVAFSPDGKSFAAAPKKTPKVKLWDIGTGESIKTFEGHSEEVNGVDISPDGRWLLSTGSDKQTFLWNIETGKLVRKHSPSNLIGRRCGFSADGSLYFVSRYDGTGRFRDTESGKLRLKVTGSDCAAISLDKRLVVATGFSALGVYRVNLAAPTESQSKTITKLISQFADDDYNTRINASKEVESMGLIATSQLRDSMNAEDAETRARSRIMRRTILSPKPNHELKSHKGEPEVCCMSPDGTIIASGCRGGEVKIWSVKDASELRTLEIPTKNP